MNEEINLEQLRKRHEELNEEINANKCKQLEKCKTIAGDHFDIMTKSLDATGEYLRNDNSDLRAVALVVFRDFWRGELGQDVYPQIVRIAFEDSEISNQANATLLLRQCELAYNDKELKQKLAKRGLATNVDAMLRYFSYLILCDRFQRTPRLSMAEDVLMKNYLSTVEFDFLEEVLILARD